MGLITKATELLRDFKGDRYAFGTNVLQNAGIYAQEFGIRVLVVGNRIYDLPVILERQGLNVVNETVLGARPNAPIEDVTRIAQSIMESKPDCIIAIGGGSTIDAVKAASVLATVGGELNDYFGTDLVSQKLARQSQKLYPLVAIATVPSSGAHLTKYSNVTNLATGQKKLIVDNAIVPNCAVFDYSVIETVPKNTRIDGMLDTISHLIEVFYGINEENYSLVSELVETGLELVLTYGQRFIEDSSDGEAQIALGLASDLGGYAIMVGGTNGAHLTSFSLVDFLTHGRACGILNLYYTVFFAPAIEPQLNLIGNLFQSHGFITESVNSLKGRKLGEAVAGGLSNFLEALGAPTSLGQLPEFKEEYLERAIIAAKDPQLAMKLQNMPIALTPDSVDQYLRPILESARIGDFSIIPLID